MKSNSIMFLILLMLVLSLMTANAQEVTIDGLKYYLYADTHEAALNGNNSWVGELDIPSEVSYNGERYTVNAMSVFAFYECKELTKVRIPKTIDHIINYTLSDDDTSSGAISPDYKNAFMGCTSLETILVDEENPSMKSIGGILFSKDGTELYCYPAGIKAESYVVSEGVTWIGGDAFAYNNCLVSVELPETVSKLCNGVFRYCTKLEKVNLPQNLTFLEGFMFWECSSLKSIEIPSGVKNIGDRAFWNCSSLKAIDLHENVTLIGGYAFYGCNLDDLVIRGILDSGCTDGSLFEGLNESARIYVLASELDRYKSKFNRIFLPLEDYISGILKPTHFSETSAPVTYDLNGRRLNAQPTKGIYIQNRKKHVVVK